MIRKSIAHVLMAGALVSQAGLSAQDRPPAESNQRIEAIVRQYILDHPDVLMESVGRYQQRQQIAQRELSKGSIRGREADLLHDASSPVIGQDKADITIVEFFDYHCGYCKRVHPTVMKLLSDNPRVRVIFKEYPILGAESLIAAKAGLAAQLQHGYAPFHRELMSMSEPLTVAAMERLAVKLGLDPVRLRADMESPAISEAIRHNEELGTAIGVDATPSFVINSELVSGALDAAAFQALIDKAGAAHAPKRPSGL